MSVIGVKDRTFSWENISSEEAGYSECGSMLGSGIALPWCAERRQRAVGIEN